jgi:hypothetical protein
MNDTQITDAIRTLIEEKNIAVDSLTRDQLAEALLQALACGDFVRNVRVDTEAQQVVYVPFREVESLRSQVHMMHCVLENVRTLFESQYGPNPSGQPLSKYEIQFVRRQLTAILNMPAE